MRGLYQIPGISIGLCLLALSACDRAAPVAPLAVPEITGFRPSQGAVDLFTSTSRELDFEIHRNSTLKGPITLSVKGMPPGVTAAFHPSTIGQSEVQSQLFVTVGPAVVPGTYTLIARAVGEHDVVKETALSVRVDAPTLSFAVETPSFSIAQQAYTSTYVRIERKPGWKGRVVFSAKDLPSGVSATFSPDILQDGQTWAMMILHADEFAQTGVANARLVAAGEVEVQESVPIMLNVTAAGPPLIRVKTDSLKLDIVRGQSAELLAYVERAGGYAGYVYLEVLGAHVGTVIRTDEVAPYVFRIRVETSASANIVSQTLQVIARSEGLSSASTPLTVTLKPAPPG